MKTYDYSSHFVFIEAVCKNSYDVILEAYNDLNFTEKNPFHWTPLHYSVAFDNQEITTKILESHDDYLNVQDKYQRTAISLAARRGNSNILKILLAKGAALSIGLPLCYAATKGDPDCILSLIQAGCNVNELDTISTSLKFASRYTPLIIAIKENHPKVVELLIKHGADVNFGAGCYLTPLHWACQDGTLEMVRGLVENGADLNHRCQHGNIALDYAILHDKVDIIRYLLEQGCSLNNVEPKFGETPLHTVAGMFGSIESAKEMMKYSPELDIQNGDGATPLYLCCYNTEVSNDIFEAFVEGNANVTISASNSWTPLHLCCATGNLKCVKLILEKSKDAVNTVTMDNITPLYIAASRGHTEICKTLLENGAYINIKVNKFRDLCDLYPYIIGDEVKIGYTAETIALEREYHDIVELLMYYKNEHSDKNMESIRIIDYIKDNVLNETNINDFDNSESDVLGWTCLHHAAELGNSNVMQLCIDRVKNVNITDKYGRTPLTIAAANGHIHIMELLRANGADISLGGALFYAIENKQLNSVKYIVEADGNVNIQDRRKRTPMMYATIKKDISMLEILLQKSFDITLRDEDDETVLHHSRHCPGDILDLLIKNGADINVQNICDETPLFATVLSDNLEATKVLLKNGADVNISNHFHDTPLHRAAEYGNLEIVKEILKYSPNMNVKDSDSHTPFMLSLENNDKRILEIMIEHGADLNINMDGGWTPLHICAYEEAIEFVKFLFEHNIDINGLTQESIHPIYIASARGRVDFVRELILNKSLIDVRITNLSDWRDFPHFINRLPKLCGSTPLIAAVCGGHLEVVKLLHGAGASLEAVTESLMDPLELAVTHSHLSIFKYLMEQNLNLSTPKKGRLCELAADDPEFKVKIEEILFSSK